ncbi:hypothetical protein PUN28_000795 [Cardiocondyla obscurior]|uniref:Uncharacterized protein n=1 Tax=Cardiocondyla obscurior TaxID=286306 RepID=A0AAW2H1G1_9HYME
MPDVLRGHSASGESSAERQRLLNTDLLQRFSKTIFPFFAASAMACDATAPDCTSLQRLCLPQWPVCRSSAIFCASCGCSQCE